MLEEMVAAAATIEAAEIQKWGTIYGSIIGGASLAIGVLASWYTGLGLQKHARLGELRREVYLELSESYSILITEMELSLNNFGGDWSNLLKSASILRSKIDKALFVCETKNKEKIYIFSKILTTKIEEFIAEISPLKSLASKHASLLVEKDELSNRINEIVINIGVAGIDDNSPNSDQDIKEHFNQLRKQLRELALEIKEVSSELIAQSESKIKYIKGVVSLLNKDFLQLVHRFRTELGVKNNVNLDNQMYTQYKS